MTPIKPDLYIAKIARKQHGIITTEQLRECGMGYTTIQRRVKSAQLFRVFRGVYAIGFAPQSQEARWIAAVLASGQRAAIAGMDAARLWGITNRSNGRSVHIVAPFGHQVSRIGITSHTSRTLQSTDVTRRNGIPVTTVTRTLLDLADTLTAHQLAHVMHEAAYRGWLKVQEVNQQIDRTTGRAASTVLFAALVLHRAGSAGTRSTLEDAFLDAIWNAGIPLPDVNKRVSIAPGLQSHKVRGDDLLKLPTRLEVDFSWPSHRLCVEVDGPGHRRPSAQRRDAMRDELLRHSGFTVLRCQPFEFDTCIQQIKMILLDSETHDSSDLCISR